MNQHKPIAVMRERAGLTQSELAELVGVSENTIANWEKGGASKWIRHLINLCRVFNCQLQDLDPNPETQALAWQDLTPQNLEMVKEYTLALLSKNKKAASRIASVATLYDKSLRYLLGQVDELIDQIINVARKPDNLSPEIIINTIILHDLNMRLSQESPNEVSIDDFKKNIQTLRLKPDFLEPYINFGNNHFSRNLILQTRYFSAYVIGWEPGQISFIHHHGNSLDAILIVRGQMEHWLLSPEQCEDKGILYEGCKSANKYEGESSIHHQEEWVFVDRRYGHQIQNSSEGRLVTLHIRFGAPPDDDKWSPNQGQAITISNQTERYQVILQHNKSF